MPDTKKYEYLMYIQNVLIQELEALDRLFHSSDEETTIVLENSIKMVDGSLKYVDKLMKKEGE